MTPTHASTPCLEIGCFKLATHKGRCAQCQLLQGGERVAYDRARGGPRERGYGRKWEKRRKAWLAIEPFCRMCAGQTPGNQVDHVIPHRDVDWLFDLVGNLQTLCRTHHTSKTMRERTIPIGMMYPLDLPEAPHYRPTRLLCGPSLGEGVEDTDVVLELDFLKDKGKALTPYLQEETETRLTVLVAAPRTAERAFWSYVLDVEAELQTPPIEWVVDGHPAEWWGPYMIDGKAEEAMARRLG